MFYNCFSLSYIQNIFGLDSKKQQLTYFNCLSSIIKND